MYVSDYGISEMGGMMPNQAHGRCAVGGVVFNRSWSFGARHGEWHLYIGADGKNSDEIIRNAAEGELVASGAAESAGCWLAADVMRTIIKAFEELAAPKEDVAAPKMNKQELIELIAGWAGDLEIADGRMTLEGFKENAMELYAQMRQVVADESDSPIWVSGDGLA